MMRERKIMTLALLFLFSATLAFSDTYKIVVLPFDKINKEKDSDLETLIHGISETLSGALTNVNNFIIIDSTRVKRYLLDNTAFSQSIGDEGDKSMDKLRKITQDKLSGDYIIYGSFQKIGKQINLNAKFLIVDDGKVLKAASVHGEYPDKIFDLQEELAKKLIAAINGKVDSGQTEKINDYITSTEDYTAYKYYINGRMIHLKYSTKEYPKALELYQKAVDKDPGYALAWAGMCEVNALWGYQIQYLGGDYRPKFDLAIQQGKKAVELGGNLYQTHRALSLAYMSSSDFNNANRAIEPAYNLNDSDPEILWIKSSLTNYGYMEMAKQGTQSNTFIMKAINNNPDLIVARWALAHSYYTAKMYDSAIAEYQKVLFINPNHTQCLWGIANTYYVKQDYPRTVEYAKQAVTVDPEVPQHHYVLAIGYYMMKDWQNAESSFRQAISKKQNYPEAIYWLGQTYYNSGRFRQAKEAFDNVLKYNPSYPEAQKWRDMSQQMMYQNQQQ